MLAWFVGEWVASELRPDRLSDREARIAGMFAVMGRYRSFLSANLINLSVAVSGLMVFSIGVMLAWQAYASYLSASNMREATSAINDFQSAAIHQARERGLGSAALGGHLSEALLGELQQQREQGDASWAQAQASAREVASPQLGTVMGQLERLMSARNRLEEGRRRVDRSMEEAAPAIELDEWFEVSTEAIARGAGVATHLRIALETTGDDAHLNAIVKETVGRIGEQAGQIRAILSYHAAAQQPLSPEWRRFIETNQQEIDRLLQELDLIREALEADSPLVEHLAAMDVAITEHFYEDLGGMMARADTGDYPMDGMSWYGAATEAIDTAVVDVSRFLADRSRSQADAIIRRHVTALGIYLLFAVVASVLAVRSLRQVRRRADELFINKELAETTLHSIGDAVMTTDRQGRVQYLNPTAEQLTGWSREQVRGRPAQQVLRVENTHHASMVDPIGTCLREEAVIGLTSGHVLIRRDGERVGIEDSAAPIRDRNANVVGCVVVFYDTSNVNPRGPDHLLSYHATRDVLTGLINRREFERQLQSLLEEAQAQGSRHVLAYLDMDQFKVVNDTCGHSAGDRMLRQLTFLLRKRVRGTDTLARLGGDEFALLLRNCSADQAEKILESLLRTVREFRFSWKGRVYETSVTVGAVEISCAERSVSVLLSEADAACNAAKSQGRNRIRFYRPDDVELSRQQGEMNWVSEITDALREGRFELYCQELMPLRADLSGSLEVLVRLRDRNDELVSPMAFIPAAERYNLMPDIDRWIIRAACEQLARVSDGGGGPRLHINLSGLSLSDPDLPGFIREQIQRFGISPGQLCFEITETAAVDSIDAVLELIESMTEEGYSFALDDFGTGLSSLTYLKNMPIQQIKIDGAFVRNMIRDDVDRVMVESVVHIARALGITVTAEFVENAETLDALRNMGVDYAQGYHVGRPAPLTSCLDVAENVNTA